MTEYAVGKRQKVEGRRQKNQIHRRAWHCSERRTFLRLLPLALCLLPCSLNRVGRGLSLPFVARRLGEESPDTIRQRAARKGGGWRRKPPVTESVTENIPPCRAIRAARVKRRGKSSPLRPQGKRQDKPHAVQDRTEERPAWPQSRASGRNPSGISRTPRKRGTRVARSASREMTAAPPAMAEHRIRLTPADPLSRLAQQRKIRIWPSSVSCYECT